MNEQMTFNYMYPEFKITQPIRLIELFAGIGAQAKALERLGCEFEHYRVVEFDKFAIKSYNAIHGCNFTPVDITKIGGDDLGIINTDKYCYIMTYSFPCQDLSIAGKQKGMSKENNTRSGLLWEVERLLNECDELPQVLLMENVTQIHSKKNNDEFIKWMMFLESKGYSNYYADLNSKNYAVPQNRNRTFMISILGKYNYSFPKNIKLTQTMQDRLELTVDEKYILSKKGINYISNPKRVRFVRINPKVGCTIMARANSNWNGNFVTCHLAENLQGDKWGTYEQSRRVYYTDGLCPTINTQQGGGHTTKIIEKEYIRKLTPKECFRLMDFDDDDYEKCSLVNSDCQLYKQAGNSIVVAVLEAIFKQML